MLKFFTKLLDLNRKEVDRLAKVTDQVNSFEEKEKKLKSSDFAKKTTF